MASRKRSVKENIENDLPGYSHFLRKYEDLEIKAAARLPDPAKPIVALGAVAGLTHVGLAKVAAGGMTYVSFDAVLICLAIVLVRVAHGKKRKENQSPSEPRAGP